MWTLFSEQQLILPKFGLFLESSQLLLLINRQSHICNWNQFSVNYQHGWTFSETISIHTKAVSNWRHSPTPVESNPQFVQLEKSDYNCLFRAINSINISIPSVRSKVSSRLWDISFLFGMSVPWPSVIFRPRLANGKHFTIHWMLRSIHRKKYVLYLLSISLSFVKKALFLSGSHTKIAYQEFSEKTEKLCEWFCIAMLGSCSFCSCLTLIFSFVNYYIFNMGEKSFYLMYATV